ncbi:type II toxin-antitoxin system VapC family toxin [Trichothermofontia sichuanensis B231]|uniref:type II toxin-antitoxin system VapC family toxin n=1 Tax=Trichothermofontia sichuanensis TaxID=3045816 RepID=UPI0022457CC4|nr:type II toxin-antitoxin system VapC family toxin [Trichothermofontia sichuanensis]UZQ56049.1 type II toxin-antitoxin system VapC family toxin [Trichothermofontia sichuanensis B231]
MKLLLDTQCWLWWFAQPEKLNENVIEQIADETNEVWFSVMSIWEMGIKVSIGKLSLPEQIDDYISSRMTQLGARSLEITASHALRVAALLHHRDPFDQMLIAQAQVEEMTLVSADSTFNQYEVSLLWAANS